MRAIDPNVLAALEADRFTFFFLLHLGFTSALYLTDFEHEVYYDGDTYLPRGIQFDAIQGNASLAVDSLDIDIDDTDQAISAILLSEDVRNRWGTIYLGVITETDGPPDAVTREEKTAADWVDAYAMSMMRTDGDTLVMKFSYNFNTVAGDNLITMAGDNLTVEA